MLSNVVIGDKSVVFATHLIIPDNEQAKFQAIFRVGPDPNPIGAVGMPANPTVRLNVSLLFASGEGDTQYNFAGENVSFTFKGWKNPLGTCFTHPVKVGTIDMGFGKEPLPFGFVIANYWIGSTTQSKEGGLNVVTLQVVTGGKYDE